MRNEVSDESAHIRLTRAFVARILEVWKWMKIQTLSPLDTSAMALIEGFCAHAVNRGSYMSVHVLLNLLNELGKSDKMRGLLSIFFSFSERV